jgi:hypothetical protein
LLFCAWAGAAAASPHVPARNNPTDRWMFTLALPARMVASLQECFRNGNWFLTER